MMHPLVRRKCVMKKQRSLDHKKIVSLYESGKSGVEIAEELGYSNYGVYHALKLNGVVVRKGAKRSDTEKRLGLKPTKRWMRDLLKEHDCASAAAEAVDIPYPTFVNWMERLGVDRERWRGGPRENGLRQDIPVEEAMRLSDQGTTYQELADRYGVSYGVIAKRLREAGYKSPVKTRKFDERIKSTPYPHRKVIQEIGIFECEICGEGRAIDLAHIVSRRNGGPTCADNSLVLCPTHHRLFDRDKLTKEELSKIKRKVRRAWRLYGSGGN